MAWAAFADMALKAVQGISGGILEEANVNAKNTVNEANAYASNLVRTANNGLKAARGSLARYNQSINNQRALENSGSAAAADSINYRRQRDSAASDDLESQIADAEQKGAQAAAGAFSGLTGGVADMVASTTALRRSRIQQRTTDALRGMDYDAAQRQKNILQAGWDSLDTSEVDSSMDMSTDVAVKQTYSGSLIMDALKGQSAQTMADVTNQAGGFFKSFYYDAFDPRAGVRGQRGY
jgi:hypothetical protein